MFMSVFIFNKASELRWPSLNPAVIMDREKTNINAPVIIIVIVEMIILSVVRVLLLFEAEERSSRSRGRNN